jgi:hypothetical protein
LNETSTKQKLKDAWGGFLSELGDRAGGWDWWTTLTFREPPQALPNWTKVGWAYTGKAWDKFIDELGARKGMNNLWWVRGREYQQWRGVPHFHALIGGLGDQRRLDMMDWWYHSYGIARIEAYDRSQGAGFYLCKYVTKELGDIQFSPGLAAR